MTEVALATPDGPDDPKKDKLIDPSLANLPAHLIAAVQAGVETGMEDMQQFLTPPRLKVCQSNRKEQYKQFPEASVLVTPQNEIVCLLGEFFIFTPIYVFDTYCIHNPWNLRETLKLNWIRETSGDPDGEIARKARKFTTEPCPEDPKEKITYAVHINTVMYIHHVESLRHTPVTFSQFIGEAKSGRRMLDLFQARTSNGTPLYAHKFMARVNPTPRKSKGNEWYGIDVTNPSADYDGTPWVDDPKLFEDLGKLREKMKANRDNIIDYTKDDDDLGGESVDTVTSDTL